MEIMKYQGEWYVLTVLFVFILILLFMPKRNLTWAGIFITLGVAGFLTWVSDSIAGSVFDLFDLAKKNTTELSDSFLLSFVPASISVIYVNFYSHQKRWIIAFIFTFLSFFLELGLVKVGYMNNNNWKTWYGLPVYFMVYRFFFPWFLKLISTKRLVKVTT
ncbi:hypothetical protein [Neobacillus cucumis]|uniref:hypothetical protein n=1 Tax=Neobacillus cucumis TaxID=1740721 RepID=UPI002E1E0B31|nr:hypothetical protein [Neobacillus cucumis]